MKTLLITGAAGAVGRMLRPELAGRYRLRLSDRQPITGLTRNESFARGDISRLADMKRITKGVDAILHLGGFSVEGPWEDILEANIIGCYNLFEAARLNGVKRILFATSNHACGFFRRDQTIDHTVYPRPDSRYGVSKVFGEQLGSLYVDKYGMEVLCLRIGNVAPAPVDKRRLSIWVSPRDLAQLIGIGVDRPDIKFEIVYGVSGNRRSWYDNRNATRLGYRPQDDSEAHAAEVLAKEPPGDALAERYQGGTFVRAEVGGDPSRPPPKVRGRGMVTTRSKKSSAAAQSPSKASASKQSPKRASAAKPSLKSASAAMQSPTRASAAKRGAAKAQASTLAKRPVAAKKSAAQASAKSSARPVATSSVKNAKARRR